MRGPFECLAVASAICSSLINVASANPTDDLVERATANSTNGAATFIYSENGNSQGNFTFTITVNPDNHDLWFRVSAPAEYSWIGIGGGSEMAGTTMFIIYEAAKSGVLEYSPRKATGHTEPTYTKDVRFGEAVPPPTDPHPNGIKDEIYFASGHCSNCTSIAQISPTNKFQPFIFAVGPPGHAARVSSTTAPLRRHALYGNFQLDMTQAHGIQLPTLGTKAVGVQGKGYTTTDHERGSPGHALVMCLAFVIVFPLGVFILRILEKVNLHMYAQTAGLVLVLIGFISGLVISKTYNRSKNYNTGHQIVGILVFILLLGQWVLGFLHHRTYLRTQQPTWMIKPHKFALGPITMALGIINAALGFRLAIAGYFNVVYVPIVLAVFIIMTAAIGVKRFFAGRRRKAGGGNVPFGGPASGGPAPPYGAPGGYAPQTPYGGQAGATYGGYDSTRSDIALGSMGQPPSYSQQPAKPREML